MATTDTEEISLLLLGSSKVRCSVQARSRPTVQWLWSQDCSGSFEHLNFDYDYEQGQIKHPGTWHFDIPLGEEIPEKGCFNCTASLFDTVISQSVMVQPESGTPVYVMISGVLGGLAAILAIAFAYFCLNRKYLCQRKHLEPSAPSRRNSSRRQSEAFFDPNVKRTSLAYVWDGEGYTPVLIPEEVEQSLRQSLPEDPLEGQSSTSAPPPLALYPLDIDAPTDEPSMYYASPTFLPLDRTLDTVQETSTPEEMRNDSDSESTGLARESKSV